MLHYCSDGDGDDVDDVDIDDGDVDDGDIEIGGEMVCSDGDGWRDCDG